MPIKTIPFCQNYHAYYVYKNTFYVTIDDIWDDLLNKSIGVSLEIKKHFKSVGTIYRRRTVNRPIGHKNMLRCCSKNFFDLRSKKNMSKDFRYWLKPIHLQFYLLIFFTRIKFYNFFNTNFL